EAKIYFHWSPPRSLHPPSLLLRPFSLLSTSNKSESHRDSGSHTKSRLFPSERTSLAASESGAVRQKSTRFTAKEETNHLSHGAFQKMCSIALGVGMHRSYRISITNSRGDCSRTCEG
ncbi:hypothetical protein J437_LFUL001485, partial [Ladona fulva]